MTVSSERHTKVNRNEQKWTKEFRANTERERESWMGGARGTSIYLFIAFWVLRFLPVRTEEVSLFFIVFIFFAYGCASRNGSASDKLDRLLMNGLQFKCSVMVTAIGREKRAGVARITCDFCSTLRKGSERITKWPRNWTETKREMIINGKERSSSSY